MIWGSISEGTLKKGVRTITTGWEKFQNKGMGSCRVFVEFFVVQLVHTSTVGQYDN